MQSLREGGEVMAKKPEKAVLTHGSVDQLIEARECMERLIENANHTIAQINCILDMPELKLEIELRDSDGKVVG